MGRNLWEPSFLVRTYGMGEFHAGSMVFPDEPAALRWSGSFWGATWRIDLGRRDQALVPVGARGRAGDQRSDPGGVPALARVRAFRLAGRFWHGTAFAAIPVALVWSIFGSVFGSFFTAPFMSTIQGVAPLRMRAFAAAVSTLISTLVGLAAGPLLVGVLADGFAVRFGDDALRYSLLVPTCAPLLSSLVCFLGARRVAGDLERARASDG